MMQFPLVMIIILVVAFTVRAGPSSPRQGSSFPDLSCPLALRIVCYTLIGGPKDQLWRGSVIKEREAFIIIRGGFLLVFVSQVSVSGQFRQSG
ncbi:hypothetical protein EI94DRAFT_1727522 [Lactarius quietus]|nr:hypothetical protein EI94DRAFT_1727522 [Lactarius quietus]